MTASDKQAQIKLLLANLSSAPSGSPRLHPTPAHGDASHANSGRTASTAASSMSNSPASHTTQSALSAAPPLSAPGPTLCRPWERSDYFRRLESFKIATWFAKPSSLSPLRCALYGWLNVDADTLECATCRARLIVQIPPDLDSSSSAESALAGKYCSMLQSSHRELCPWKTSSSPESFQTLQLSSQAVAKDDFDKRCRSFAALADRLPVVSPAAMDLILSQSSRHSLLDLVAESGIPQHCAATVLCLSVCNWEAKQFGGGSYTVVCSVCARSVGLWLFQPRSPEADALAPPDSSAASARGKRPLEADAEEDTPARAKSARLDSASATATGGHRPGADSNGVRAFDPFEQHRWFCPCHSRAESGEAEWMRLLDALQPTQPVSPTRVHTPADTLASVKKVLAQASSPAARLLM